MPNLPWARAGATRATVHGHPAQAIHYLNETKDTMQAYSNKIFFNY